MTPFTPTGGDDTAALQSAIAGARSLEILAGDSKISTPIVVDHECEIVFRKGAKLLADDPSCDVLSIQHPHCRLIEPRIEAAQPRTGGAYVRLKSGLAHRFKSEGGRMNGYHTGIAIEQVSTVNINDLLATGGVAGQGSLVSVDGGYDLKLTSITADGPTDAQPEAGVKVLATGDLKIVNCAFMHHGTAVFAQALEGKQISSLWIVDTYLDNNGQRGLLLRANGGTIARTRVAQSWASSCGMQGVLALADNGGQINGLQIEGLQAFDNGQAGLHAEGNVSALDVLGGAFAGNVGVGIAIGSGIQKFSVSNVTSGPWGIFGGNTWGIFLGGSNNNYILSDCRLQGNSVGKISGHVASATRISTGHL